MSVLLCTWVYFVAFQLHIMDLTKIEDVFQSEVMPISLRSWSTLVVIQTAENEVSLMDTTNMSEAYTWTSESVM